MRRRRLRTIKIHTVVHIPLIFLIVKHLRNATTVRSIKNTSTIRRHLLMISTFLHRRQPCVWRQRRAADGGERRSATPGGRQRRAAAPNRGSAPRAVQAVPLPRTLAGRRARKPAIHGRSRAAFVTVETHAAAPRNSASAVFFPPDLSFHPPHMHPRCRL